MEVDTCRINRVNRSELKTISVSLPEDAGVFAREVGALAKAYLGAIDQQGDVETMLGHLDPSGFTISLPTVTLTSEKDYRDWYRGIVAAFSESRHTVVALAPTLISRDAAQVTLSVHFEADRRRPAQNETPRANDTVDIIWDLTRSAEGRWLISGQRGAPHPTPAFSRERTRQFAAGYLGNLDQRNLEGMLGVLAPQSELNIALNGGRIVENFPQWFRMIADTFINSKHRIQGLVPLQNADGTLDVHLRIHFTADRRQPQPNEDAAVELTVDRIWTLRPDKNGRPQLVSQRPFAPLVLSTRVDPLDVDRALEAARRGDNEVVRNWLRNGGNPNAYARDGFNLFLAAAATGNTDAIRLMLVERVGPHMVDPDLPLEDPKRPTYRPNILAAHLSSQKGAVATTLLLLSRRPEQLHARMEVNGHTPLLQAAFYGHVELARSILDNLGSIVPQGADVEEQRQRLFSETTVRGLNATQLGRQFLNQAMIDALAPFDKATTQARQADTMALLDAIPGGPRHPDAGTPTQAAGETVILAIMSGLAEVASLREPQRSSAVTRVTRELQDAVQNASFDPNRLAGELLQTPIIAAVTGSNANEGVARLRRDIVELLLKKGADPDKEEVYPMAVDAIIRAAVFNHFDSLKMFEAAMTPEAMQQALNHQPAVNGLTALHDSVLRAATGAPGYLAQIRWARGLGARVDLPDHTGRTQRDIAAAAFVTEGQKDNAAAVWEALQLDSPPYALFSYDNLTFLTIPDHVADKGAVWRTLAGASDVIVKSIDLDGPNAL